MKKLIFLLSLLLILTACGSTNTANESESNNSDSTSNQETIELDEASNEDSGEVQTEIESDEEEAVEQLQVSTINLGEVVVIEDFAEIEVIKNVFGKRIDPPNPGTFYSYYENKETDEIYLDTVIKVKSLLTSGRSSDQFVDVKIVYDNKYEYRTFSTIEDKGGSDFTFTNITSIEPLKTGTLHFLASVPAEIENDGKPLKAVITINGKEYEQIIR